MKKMSMKMLKMQTTKMMIRMIIIMTMMMTKLVVICIVLLLANVDVHASFFVDGVLKLKDVEEYNNDNDNEACKCNYLPSSLK
jgi:hypothetical protein